MSVFSVLNSVRFKAAWITVAIFAGLELLVRLTPMQYGMGAGVFLTDHRRDLVDGVSPAGVQDFDYIIFGESRSLSLSGHAATEAEPYSVYNLSLPAMGSRYYAKFLRKYLAGHERPPAAVIFAADPGVFQEAWGRPLHDPAMRYADGADESLLEYLGKRTTRRVSALFTATNGSAGASPDASWENYSHRFLHLFSPRELIQYYTGAERLFLLREAMPLQYYSYRYRESIRQNMKLLFSGGQRITLPPECQRCEFLDAPQCRPELSNIQDNLLISEHLARTQGGINLGDRLTPVQRMQFGFVRAKLIQATAENFERARPDLEPLAELIAVAREHGVKIILAPTPSVRDYRDTAYYKYYYQQLAELQARYADTLVATEFPEPFIPGDRFVDQIHYDCPTAVAVNADFQNYVLPRVVQLAPVRSR